VAAITRNDRGLLRSRWTSLGHLTHTTHTKKHMHTSKNNHACSTHAHTHLFQEQAAPHAEVLPHPSPVCTFAAVGIWLQGQHQQLLHLRARGCGTWRVWSQCKYIAVNWSVESIYKVRERDLHFRVETGYALVRKLVRSFVEYAEATNWSIPRSAVRGHIPYLSFMPKSRRTTKPMMPLLIIHRSPLLLIHL
jgi:hypothetical protein